MLVAAWNGPTIYAALVGSVGLVLSILSFGWQIFRWLRSRGTRMRVEMWSVSAGSLGAGKAGFVLVISAFNQSEHPVNVISVGIESELGSESWTAPPGATLPGTVQPLETGFTSRSLGLL